MFFILILLMSINGHFFLIAPAMTFLYQRNTVYPLMCSVYVCVYIYALYIKRKECFCSLGGDITPIEDVHLIQLCYTESRSYSRDSPSFLCALKQVI